jgi:uncharacterized protein (DUF433 family)
MLDSPFLGVGIYSIPEAARLSKVSTWRIRRWLRGYEFRKRSGIGHSDPVWRHGLPECEGRDAVSFQDLIEARFVDAFLKAGVSWKHLRRVAEIAREKWKLTHPFCSGRFLTDGRILFVEAADRRDPKTVIEVVTDQLAFQRVVEPCRVGIEFVDDMASRWWPLGQRRQVVVDPQRSFGQPIVPREGVRTRVLYAAHRANGSIELVVKWFEVSPGAVNDAIEFERGLASA